MLARIVVLGSADPAYYGMRVTYLHGSPFFVRPEDMRESVWVSSTPFKWIAIVPLTSRAAPGVPIQKQSL